MLIDKLEELGLRENTYFFFLSDNGGRNEMPGQSKDRQLPRNHPLRDEKGSMYEGGIRVPFIVSGPDVMPGSVSDVPVTGLDLLPTLAEIAGYTERLPDAIDGGSLVEVLRHGGRGTVQRTNPFLMFHQAVARNAQSAIIQDGFKLVKTWDEGRVELFHLDSDIGEQSDLSNTMPDRRDQLHVAMTKFLDDVGAECHKTMDKAKQRELFAPPRESELRSPN